MERRIRRVEITSTTDGVSQEAFIVNTTDTTHEVLALEGGFTFMFFDRQSLIDSTGRFTLHIPQEHL